ncbi:STAS domain-containing protein [Actinomadura napierensis]|uniref:Anti-sigma factor antagonist n=1 Tax=Actinomadura napierensis TaxID=267854 RepID=A0ABP5JV15_9ACTN
MTTFETAASVAGAAAKAPAEVAKAPAEVAKAPAEVAMPAHRRPAHTIVALHGALDASAAPALREQLIGVLRHCGRLLVLDLSEVPSGDETGLAVLVGTLHRAAALGVTVRLDAPGRQLAELLHITGLDRVFHTPLTPPARIEPAA